MIFFRFFEDFFLSIYIKIVLLYFFPSFRLYFHFFYSYCCCMFTSVKSSSLNISGQSKQSLFLRWKEFLIYLIHFLLFFSLSLPLNSGFFRSSFFFCYHKINKRSLNKNKNYAVYLSVFNLIFIFIYKSFIMEYFLCSVDFIFHFFFSFRQY